MKIIVLLGLGVLYLAMAGIEMFEAAEKIGNHKPAPNGAPPVDGQFVAVPEVSASDQDSEDTESLHFSDFDRTE